MHSLAISEGATSRIIGLITAGDKAILDRFGTSVVACEIIAIKK
jgi:hypothetical protein